MHSPYSASGQTLPLFAIMVPGMLALMALGLDGAQMMLERRDAQGAADLAALSGARALPGDPAQARADAIAIAAANGFTITAADITTPYSGSTTHIEVKISTSVDTFFMPIFGLAAGGDFSSVSVSARAVAQIAFETGFGDAIFAAKPSCGALPSTTWWTCSTPGSSPTA